MCMCTLMKDEQRVRERWQGPAGYHVGAGEGRSVENLGAQRVSRDTDHRRLGHRVVGTD